MAKANFMNSILVKKPTKSFFDLSHDVKLSCNMGQLVPVMCTEVIPGDKIGISCESLIRFAPMVAPAMHRFDCTMHYFFVPNRILWKNWENFITQTKVGGNVPAFPYISMNDPNYNKLADYMGIPRPDQSTGTATETISALPFAAYQKVWNDYYRDQNLQTDIFPSDDPGLTDGNNTSEWTTKWGVLRFRAWEHDYFTSSLPFAQKGDPVNIPLNFPDVPVLYNNPTPNTLLGTAGNVALAAQTTTDTTELLYANTSTLDQNTTINDLRRAIKLQEWLEKNARGGTRYIEHIMAHFGVKSSDKRLQRPEYITGIKTPITISEVLQTSSTDAETPQGNMAGHGVGVGTGNYSAYYAEEHGYIIGVMSILPKTAYQQGIPRHFLKTQDPFQYFYPSFANIGEQEVYNRELYAYTATGGDTFGYLPRYAEYRTEFNRVAGDFRTNLDYWHAGRIFGSQPELNEDFVVSDPTFRIFADTNEGEDHMWCHILNKVAAIRPIPKFGTPSM